MIAGDQPTCFDDSIVARVSSKDDGTMLDKAIGVHNGSIVSNRTRFVDSCGISYGDAVYQRIIYDEARTYELIAEVDAGSTTKFTSEVVADVLYTTIRGVGLMLPVADCAATVVHDPVRHALAVVHLGRHSSYAKLASRIVDKFVNEGSVADDLIVWMCPHAGKKSYKLAWFDRRDDPDWRGFYRDSAEGAYLDLAGFNSALLEKAGVRREKIFASPIDTMCDGNYFSHASGDTTGRIMVLAYMK